MNDLLDRIDSALTAWCHQSIVSADEAIDVLLDLRRTVQFEEEGD